MRKKFFAMYALVGALVASPVFTSCVDDSESASVTAIRNAKAEQLKANAAYSQAQAEYQKAQAAYYNALAEQEANETAEDKALFEYELATAKAEYEKTALEYEKEKLNYLKAMADSENQMISTAANKYSTALDNINKLTGDLLEEKKKLSQVGIDSTENVALLKDLVAAQNKIILEKTTQIERIKAYKGETEESLFQKMEAVVVNFQNLKAEWEVADDAKTAAKEAYTEAQTAYDNSGTSKLEYVKAIFKLNNATYNMGITSVSGDTYDVYPTTGSSTTLTSTSIIKTWNPIMESKVLAYTQGLNNNLKTAKDNLGAAKTDAAPATGGYAVLEALETALKTAKDGLAATPATHTQAQVDAAELLLAQYKDDVTPRNFDGDATNGNEQSLAYLLKQVADAEKAIEDFNALVAAVKEGSDEHKAWVAAQEALLAAAEAYNAAFEKEAELAEAKEATGISDVTIDVNGSASVVQLSTGEYPTLWALYNSSNDAEAMIATLEADIAEAKATIEKGILSQYTHYEERYVEYYNSNNNRWEGYTTWVAVTNEFYNITTEELKALYQATIDNIEAKLAVQEALAAKYKAELDALLAAEA